MTDKVKQMRDALSLFDTIAESVGGCSDRYCYVTGKRTGQVTNGGCRCLSRKDVTTYKMAYAGRRLRDDLLKILGE